MRSGATLTGRRFIYSAYAGTEAGRAILFKASMGGQSDGCYLAELRILSPARLPIPPRRLFERNETIRPLRRSSTLPSTLKR